MAKSKSGGAWAALLLCGLSAGMGAPSAAAAAPKGGAPANCEWRRERSRGAEHTFLYCLNASKKHELIATNTGFDEHTLARAEAGDPAAMTTAGAFFMSERAKAARNPETAVAWFRRAAEAGLPAALFNLGLAYEKGAGVGKDAAEARRWYEQAAAAGSISAELNLARAIYQAPPEPGADAEMLKRLRTAADAGQTAALVDLGLLYAAGRGVARDDAEAARWWTAAAEKRDLVSAYRLGVAYADGIGVARNDESALAWFEKGAKPVLKTVDTLIGLNLAVMGRGKVAPKDAEALFMQGAESGDPMALMTLAYCYMEAGRAQDALRLYQSGAEKGLRGPMVKLAERYASGEGVPRDPAQAIRLYRAGGKPSDLDAFRAVDEFESPGRPTT